MKVYVLLKYTYELEYIGVYCCQEIAEQVIADFVFTKSNNRRYGEAIELYEIIEEEC